MVLVGQQEWKKSIDGGLIWVHIIDNRCAVSSRQRKQTKLTGGRTRELKRPKKMPERYNGTVPGMCTIWVNKGKVTNLLA